METFIGHSLDILSLAFSSPSSLITISRDKSVKFWQIETLSTVPVPADLKSPPLASAPVKSVTLQEKAGIAISNHSNGIVRIWDISTGLCRASFQTPAKDPHWMDTHLTDGGLISIWCTDGKICIWDTEKGRLLRTVQLPIDEVMDLRISGDGSTVFCLYQKSIWAWSLWTGEIVGKVTVGLDLQHDSPLTIDGLRVWVWSSSLWGVVYLGMEGLICWDFGIPGSSPVRLSGASRNRPCMDFVGGPRENKSFLPAVKIQFLGG